MIDRILIPSLAVIIIFGFFWSLNWLVRNSEKNTKQRGYEYKYIVRSTDAIFQRYHGDERAIDAWGNEIRVDRLPNGTYYIFSCGEDGLPGTSDDFGFKFDKLCKLKPARIPLAE